MHELTVKFFLAGGNITKEYAVLIRQKEKLNTIKIKLEGISGVPLENLEIKYKNKVLKDDMSYDPLWFNDICAFVKS